MNKTQKTFTILTQKKTTPNKAQSNEIEIIYKISPVDFASEPLSRPAMIERGTEARLDPSAEEPQGERAQWSPYVTGFSFMSLCDSEIHVSQTWKAASGIKSDTSSAGHCLAQYGRERAQSCGMCHSS